MHRLADPGSGEAPALGSKPPDPGDQGKTALHCGTRPYEKERTHQLVGTAAATPAKTESTDDVRLGSATTEKTPERQSAREVRRKEVYMALVEARRAAPLDPPRAAWLMTIAELFTVTHATVQTDADIIPPEKRFPEATK